MNPLKTIRVRIALAGVVVILLMGWLVWNRIPRGPSPVGSPSPSKKANDAPTDTAQPKALLPPNNPLNVKLASAFTDEEKKELADEFTTKLKPAAEKWLRAYGDHAPFNLANLTLDKFADRMGKSSRYVYTFVLGDLTLAIQDDNNGTKVTYVMSRQAAQEMNALPASGAPPDLTTVVSQADVVSMVQADTGVQFNPNEVIIRPAATATAMSGGEFVQVTPTGADPNNILQAKVDMVFDANGKIVNYDRDPFF